MQPRGDAMDSKKLPITGPCPIDLDAIGFDRKSKKSFCSHCSKNVVNLSNFTKGEARKFLQDNAGETMCVSYARDTQGQIKFKSDAPIVPIARLRARRRPSPGPSAAAAAAAGLAFALAACAPHGDDQPTLDRTEQVDRDGTKTIIPIMGNNEPEVRMAGAAMIVPPEDHLVEGEMPIPEDDMMDGEVEIPEPGAEVQPCDGKVDVEQPQVDTSSPRPKLRGRIKLPRSSDL